MTNILKRIQQAQQTKAINADDPATMAGMLYLADMNQRRYKEAKDELHEELIEATKCAEIENAELRVQMIEKEHEALKNVLAQSQHECAQLLDLGASLKAEVQVHQNDVTKLKMGHAEIIRNQEEKIKTLEVALARAETKANVPIPQINERPLPSFEFQPVRDQNGRIESVVAKPIG